MKIKWGIPIILMMTLLVLGFFARAEIEKGWLSEKLGEEEKMISTVSKVSIFFNEKEVITNLPVPSYYANSIMPVENNWQEKTINPLVSYLMANNEKVLKITGHFLEEESEIQFGGYNNIGEARAGVIKQSLVAAGISAPRILIYFAKDNTETLKQIFNFECLNDSTIIP